MNFDLLMPLFLFSVPLAAVLLARRSEGKLRATIEEKEFGNKDIALFAALIAVAVSVIIFVPSLTILVLFLFSYSSLLFTFSYTYSNMQARNMRLYCGTFIVASILAAVAGFSGVIRSDLRIYGILAFVALAACSLFALFYAQKKADAKQKWYLAGLSPALFVLLFVFYNQTHLWFPYLLDVYAILFAMLIIIYLAPMFNWKIMFVYALAITALDVFSVWGPGHVMYQAATTLTNLNLPVLAWLPNIPIIHLTEGIWLNGLGLGDLFFTGVLSFQTMKKFGQKTTLVSMIGIALSFGLFELILLNPGSAISKLLPVQALPATLPILLGWIPAVAVKMLIDRSKPKPELQTPTTQQ